MRERGAEGQRRRRSKRETQDEREKSVLILFSVSMHTIPLLLYLMFIQNRAVCQSYLSGGGDGLAIEDLYYHPHHGHNDKDSMHLDQFLLT